MPCLSNLVVGACCVITNWCVLCDHQSIALSEPCGSSSICQTLSGRVFTYFYVRSRDTLRPVSTGTATNEETPKAVDDKLTTCGAVERFVCCWSYRQWRGRSNGLVAKLGRVLRRVQRGLEAPKGKGRQSPALRPCERSVITRSRPICFFASFLSLVSFVKSVSRFSATSQSVGR